MASFLSAEATPFVPLAKPGGRKKPYKQVSGGGNNKRNGKTGGKVGQRQRPRRSKKSTEQRPESAFATSSLGENGRISEAFLGFRYEKDDTDKYMQSQYVPKKKSKRPVEKFDRALFLISTFRFALHPSALSSPSFSRVEPERKLDWNIVEEVVVDVKGDSSINCPICLCPSGLATMSKCGHIYCRICVLRHLNTDIATRHGHAQCPICYDQIFEKDLRFARKRVVNPLKVDEQIELSLMYRQRDQVLPQLAYTPLVPKHNIFPTPTMPSSTYAKFMKCDKVWTRSIIVRQLNELKMVVSEMLSDVALLEALGHVEDAERERKEIKNLVSLTRKSLAEKALDWNLEDMLDDIAFEVEVSAPPSAAVAPIFENEDFPSLGSVCRDSKLKSTPPKPSARWGKQALEERTLKEKEPPATAVDNGCADDKAAWVEDIAGSVADGFYFYQVPTGQNAFLHPFTVSMLKEEFGTYDKFPATICGTLLDVETVTLNREKMKFYKYLMHLNMNAECDLLDLDVSSYLSERTRKKFKSDIQKRHRALKKKKMIGKGKGKEIANNGTAMFSQDCPLPDFERITSIEEERMKSVDIKNFPAVGTPPSVSAQKSPEIIPEERSFARITTNMGFFPTLGEAVSMKQPTKGASRSLKGTMRKTTNPWGQ